jgi:hypothetical protein
MKKIIFVLCVSLFSLCANQLFAQVTIGQLTPSDPSSVLQVISPDSDKGILFPSMTTLQKQSIKNPANGLIVYDTDVNKLSIYNSLESKWENLASETEVLSLIQSLNIQANNQYDIFLVAGQSNTHYGTGLDPAIDTSDPDIFQVGRFNGFDGKIIPASEPLHHWTWDQTRIGFALTFAKLYKQNSLAPGRKILLVPCGYAASSIEQWAKGGTLYNDAVLRTVTALMDNSGSVIKGILWHQGEANIGNTTQYYTGLLDAFITNIRNDLGNPNIPIVLGGMVPYYVNTTAGGPAQQSNIQNTPNRVSRAAYADPTIPLVISKPNNVTDAIHYDANGQRELGKRYYNAFITVQ